jgi:hypothetical protein
MKQIYSSSYGKAFEIPFRKLNKDGTHSFVDSDPSNVTINRYLVNHKAGNYLLFLFDLKTCTKKVYEDAKYQISSLLLNPLLNLNAIDIFNKNDYDTYDYGYHIQFHGVTVDQAKLLNLFLLESSLREGVPLDHFYGNHWNTFVLDQIDDFLLISNSLTKPPDFTFGETVVSTWENLKIN